jgi:hypothetical protein
MVKGLNSFREWFRGYESSFAIIGGTACDLLMNDAGMEFRVTKDIDMILIVESLNAEFGSRFWEYIKIGGYEHRLKSTGAPEYYRFTSPKSPVYPAMIELFSRRIEGISLPPEATLTPVPIGDDISSLSAILLHLDYYDFLRTGIAITDGIPVLDAAHLIPFKAKAWLDLTARKASGGNVDSKNITKHKNDILRLSALLSPEFSIELPVTIAEDMQAFLARVDKPEMYIRTAVAFGLSDSIPLDKLPMKERIQEAQRRADEYNAIRGTGRRKTNNHERE